MSDLQSILKEAYKKKEEVAVTPQSLIEMIEQMMGEVPIDLLCEEGEGERSIPFPSIKITELWGKTTKSGRNKSTDRQLIEALTRNIRGRTPEEKLTQIAKAVEYNPRIKVPRILSTLIFLELMRSIVVEYTESVSGFLFEGFLAGIFGATSQQITDAMASSGQVGKPITDVELHGRHYSLKLLSPTTIIEGSFKNLVGHFEGQDEIVYLVLRKEGDDMLEWYEFEINLDTFVDWIGHASKKGQVPVTNRIEISGKELEQIGTAKGTIDIDGTPYRVVRVHERDGVTKVRKVAKTYRDLGAADPAEKYYATYETGETKEEIIPSAALKHIYGEDAEGIENYKKARELGQAGDKVGLLTHLKTVPGFASKAAQFSIPRGYADRMIAEGKAHHIGTLELSEGAIRAVAEQYASKLNEELIPMYTSLDHFTRNINAYFLTGARSKDRLTHAVAASKDAVEIRDQSQEMAGETAEEAAGEERQLDLFS